MRLRRGRKLSPSRLHLRDLLSEALAGVLQRPARSALTAVGTILGVGTLVAVLGLTASASAQIDARFNVLTATEVTVEDVGSARPNAERLSFPPDADARISRLQGVEAGGVYWNVRLAQPGVRTTSLDERAGSAQTPILAASPGVLSAAAPHLVQGRLYDEWHDSSAQRVAVIGTSLAQRLGITTLDTQPALYIEGRPFLVIGIIDGVRRKADLPLSVVVPRGTAFALWGTPVGDPAKMIISTRIGAAQQVASEAALALDAARPENFRVIPPPDPRILRMGVTSDLNQLLLLLAGICLGIGAIGIANTTLIAVLERTGEIGLRRSLGARGIHITTQFLTESACIGLLGGLIGSTVGVLTVVGVSLVQEWTPIISPVTIAMAPAIGLCTGLAAGIYPAWRASRIQPAEALRR
ncbi:ABC transporter permease [Kitasatospora cineracea]|uniref:ABC transporter permease n=1 Tax=Kitasatospora cineracea TaxID=88074 RepID=UPI00341633BD